METCFDQAASLRISEAPLSLQGNFNEIAGRLRPLISRIARDQKRLYYRDQSVASLMALVNAVREMRPTTIVELGTGAGLSLRAWLAADSKLRVTAIDLSFRQLLESAQFLPVDFSRVAMIQQNIVEVDLPRLWGGQDRVILYIDAHDLPGATIMEHVLANALPALPPGSLVIVDDVWYSPETLASQQEAENFFDASAANDVDPLQYCQSAYAPYWEGGSFIGSPGTIPLLKWVNEGKVPLRWAPGAKSVSFEPPGSYHRVSDFSSFDEKLWGRIQRLPFTLRPPEGVKLLPGHKEACRLCEIATRKFVGYHPLAEVLDLFCQAHVISSEFGGLKYAIAVCLARLGRLCDARAILEDEIEAGGADSPRAEALLATIDDFERRGASGGEVGAGEAPGDVTPPEKKEDELYQLITDLTRESELRHVLEIGSSSGERSTQAFVSGLMWNPRKPQLYCIELAPARFKALERHYACLDFVHCYNASSVPAQSFPSEKEVSLFHRFIPTNLSSHPLELVLSRLRDDLAMVAVPEVEENGIELIKREHGIAEFDMVLIDGSEFTGAAELDLVHGARWLLLDDVNAFKNYANYRRLKNDPCYELYRENWHLGNGYAVFKKKEPENEP